MAEALDAYDQALELREDFPEAWYNLALILDELGETVEAAEAFETCIVHARKIAAGLDRITEEDEEGEEEEEKAGGGRKKKGMSPGDAASADRAAVLLPEAHYNMALMCHEVASQSKSIEALRAAITQYQSAIDTRAAIPGRPPFVDAQYNRKVAEMELKQWEDKEQKRERRKRRRRKRRGGQQGGSSEDDDDDGEDASLSSSESDSDASDISDLSKFDRGSAASASAASETETETEDDMSLRGSETSVTSVVGSEVSSFGVTRSDSGVSEVSVGTTVATSRANSFSSDISGGEEEEEGQGEGEESGNNSDDSEDSWLDWSADEDDDWYAAALEAKRRKAKEENKKSKRGKSKKRSRSRTKKEKGTLSQDGITIRVAQGDADNTRRDSGDLDDLPLDTKAKANATAKGKSSTTAKDLDAWLAKGGLLITPQGYMQAKQTQHETELTSNGYRRCRCCPVELPLLMLVLLISAATTAATTTKLSQCYNN